MAGDFLSKTLAIAALTPAAFAANGHESSHNPEQPTFPAANHVAHCLDEYANLALAPEGSVVRLKTAAGADTSHVTAHLRLADMGKVAPECTDVPNKRTTNFIVKVGGRAIGEKDGIKDSHNQLNASLNTKRVKCGALVRTLFETTAMASDGQSAYHTRSLHFRVQCEATESRQPTPSPTPTPNPTPVQHIVPILNHAGAA